MIGVIPTQDALQRAKALGLDLVEVSPTAQPPVCRIMDFGKYRYEESKKEKEARKNRHNQVIKEVKYHSNVAEHDYETKLGHIKEFLSKGFKVKLTLTFRGRENAHKDLGVELVKRVINDCAAEAMVDQSPRVMGRSVQAMVGPRPAKG